MYKQIASNKRKTWIIMILFVMFFLAIGYIFGFVQTGDENAAIGTMGAVGLAAILYVAIGYYSATRLTLSIAHAKPIEKKDNPELYRVVENLSIAGGVPTPKIYIIDDTALNAFATGRGPKNAHVAITKGLLDQLTKPELEGVMAHELSHVKNYDIRLQSVTVALLGLVALISDVFLRSFRHGRRRTGGKGTAVFAVLGIVLAILSPLIAKLMHLAISREREYLADASGAFLTRHPDGLAKALAKIKNDKEPLEVANKATAHMYIENPLRNLKGMKWLNNMFATHPDIDDRIARLRGMGE